MFYYYPVLAEENLNKIFMLATEIIYDSNFAIYYNISINFQ